MRLRGAATKLADYVTATVHPSSILRARGDVERELRSFVTDLQKVAAVLQAQRAPQGRHAASVK